MRGHPAGRCIECGREPAYRWALIASIDQEPVAFLCDRHDEVDPYAATPSAYSGFLARVAGRYPGQAIAIRNPLGVIIHPPDSPTSPTP